MKFWILIPICLLVVAVRCEDEGTEVVDDGVVGPTHTSELFNDRLDQIIRETIGKHRSEIVPYNLQDQRTGFWRKIGPLNITGEAGFINNSLHGLVNVRRIEDAYLGKTKWGNVQMTLNLEIGPLDLQTVGYAKFMNIGPRVSYKISVVHVDLSAVLHFNHRTEEVAVKSFNVNDILGLSFKITRAPGFVTPFVANQIINGGITIFKPLIRTAVTRTGHIVLDRIINDSDFVKDVMLEAERM